MASQLASRVPGRRLQPTGLWFYGCGFSGKTTLARALRARGLAVLESDDAFSAFPEFKDPDFWYAWRPEHPRHSRWSVLSNAAYVRLSKEFNDGAIIVAHEAPRIEECPDVGPHNVIQLALTPAELARRSASDRANQQRIQAAHHCHARLLSGKAEPRGYEYSRLLDASRADTLALVEDAGG